MVHDMYRAPGKRDETPPLLLPQEQLLILTTQSLAGLHFVFSETSGYLRSFVPLVTQNLILRYNEKSTLVLSKSALHMTTYLALSPSSLSPERDCSS